MKINVKKTLVDSILAGVCISLGGMVFLKVGGVMGAILFSFGLITVICYKLKLYTGVSGFVRTKQDFAELPLVIIGNIVGCFGVALCAREASPDVVATAQGLLEARLGKNLLQVGLLAMGCGFVMTTVVTFARQGQWLPLLFGIPLFILCGFYHSIADAFYITTTCGVSDYTWPVAALYVMELVGNFVGCNLYRFFQKLARVGATAPKG